MPLILNFFSSASNSDDARPRTNVLQDMRHAGRNALSAYVQAWKGGDNAPFAAVCLVAISFLLAALNLLLTPRTVLQEGMLPLEQWYVPLCLLLVVTLLFPANTPAPVSGLWRIAPLLLVLAPFTSLAVQIGLGMAALAGLLRWFGHPALRRLAAQWVLIAAAWLLDITLSNIYIHIVARLHNFTFLAQTLALGFRLLGMSAHSTDSRVFVYHEGAYAPILASPDKFALEFVALFVAGLLLVGTLQGLRVSRLLTGVAITGGYALIRTVGLMGGYLVYGDLPAWWHEIPVVLSFVPLIALLTVFLRQPSALQSPPAQPPAQQPAAQPASAQEPTARQSPVRGFVQKVPVGLLCALAGVFCLTLGWKWVDGGTPRRGSVMIDERYSRWEWSEQPLDTELYGVKTVYSYSNLVDSLQHYYPTTRNFQDIDDAVLAGVSVLILKTPTAPYPPKAQEAIWRFVERGGGVWLIGDHTDVFGMDTYLNLIGTHYGLQFEFNAVVDPDTNRQLYHPAPFAHPIARRMPLFLWYTSDRLAAPWTSDDVIVSPRLLVDNADFSTNTFFGNFKPDLDEPISPVIQCAAVSSGRGRIACWSDSTVFSNFAVYLPGKMELALGTVDWLNRSNGFTSARPLLLGVGGLLTTLSLLHWRRGHVVLGMWMGLAFALPCLSALYDYSYPQLQPKQPFATVAFYEPEVRSHLPVGAAVDNVEGNAGNPDCYLSVFVAAQRTGRRPVVVRTLEEALHSDTMVIVHSHYQYTKADLAHIRDWLERGGRLLLLDGNDGNIATLHSLLSVAGLSDQSPPPAAPPPPSPQISSPLTSILNQGQPAAPAATSPDSASIVTPAGLAVGEQQEALNLIGGTPRLMNAKTHKAVAMSAQVGKGYCLAAATTTLFSDEGLGENSSIPNDQQVRLLKLLYDFYRGK